MAKVSKFTLLYSSLIYPLQWRVSIATPYFNYTYIHKEHKFYNNFLGWVHLDEMEWGTSGMKNYIDLLWLKFKEWDNSKWMSLNFL